MSLIKFLESVCKQSESRADINSSCSSFLEERRNLKNCITGRDHIIDQDHIFALKVWTEEFVSCDRVTSVDSLGVIQTFVIHTHINTKDIGKIDCAVHASFIRADDHEMIVVDVKSFLMIEKSFDKLIGWLYSLKSMQRCCVLHARVMCVKGDDVFHTHTYKLLKCCCTVQGFSAAADILAAFVQIRHDHVYSAGFAADCADYTFQILKMVIRRHKILVWSDAVGKTVVTYINHQIDIVTTYRFHDRTFRLTGTETCCLDRYQIGISLITLKCKRIKLFVAALFTPLYQPFIYFFTQILTADQRDQTKSAHRKCS